MIKEAVDCIDLGTEYCPWVIKRHQFSVKWNTV